MCLTARLCLKNMMTYGTIRTKLGLEATVMNSRYSGIDLGFETHRTILPIC